MTNFVYRFSFAKIFSIIFILLASLSFADEVITIGASAVPHAEILNMAKPMLKAKGVNLQIKVFDDYIQPNLMVAQKQLDANFFQHRPYLEQFNHDHGLDLVELVGVHIEPMGVYVSNDASFKQFIHTKKLSALPKRQLLVGVPSDTTNEGRALLLLQKNGLIKIKNNVKYPTKQDVISNPYNIKFIELDSAMLPRALLAKQLDLAVINSNYAIQAHMNPVHDAVMVEAANSPYVNIVVVRRDELLLPKIQKLKQVLKSKEVRDFINKNYQGAIISVN